PCSSVSSSGTNTRANMRSEHRESTLRPQPTATPRRIRIRPRLQIRRLNPHRRQTRTHLLAMDTHMMQRLHHNHRCVRLVGTIIQKREPLAVNRLAQKPLPPGTTLLRTRGKLPQVIGLIISHCPDGTATTKTRHIARVSHHQMIQRRQNAAEPSSRSRQLVNRTIRTGSNERLRSPILLPERFDQYLVHHASPLVWLTAWPSPARRWAVPRPARAVSSRTPTSRC